MGQFGQVSIRVLNCINAPVARCESPWHSAKRGVCLPGTRSSSGLRVSTIITQGFSRQFFRSICDFTGVTGQTVHTSKIKMRKKRMKRVTSTWNCLNALEADHANRKRQPKIGRIRPSLDFQNDLGSAFAFSASISSRDSGLLFLGRLFSRSTAS